MYEKVKEEIAILKVNKNNNDLSEWGIEFLNELEELVSKAEQKEDFANVMRSNKYRCNINSVVRCHKHRQGYYEGTINFITHRGINIKTSEGDKQFEWIDVVDVISP